MPGLVRQQGTKATQVAWHSEQAEGDVARVHGHRECADRELPASLQATPSTRFLDSMFNHSPLRWTRKRTYRQLHESQCECSRVSAFHPRPLWKNTMCKLGSSRTVMIRSSCNCANKLATVLSCFESWSPALSSNSCFSFDSRFSWWCSLLWSSCFATSAFDFLKRP